MRIFDYDDYKRYVADRRSALPRGGRGELQKLARHLRVHTSLVSQVFRGDKHLSIEQVPALAEYLGLNELETEYLLALIESQRAGTVKLRRLKERRLRQLREQSQQVLSRLPPPTQTLREKDKALFYSNWYYSAIRLLTSIPEHQDVETIPARLALPKATVRRAVEFLVSTGLCVEDAGKVKVGPLRTHVAADSPLVSRHHTNWRMKAVQRFEALTDEELAFTLPMTIASADRAVVRELLGELIEKVSRVIERSAPERLTCLNIDWFDVDS